MKIFAIRVSALALALGCFSALGGSAGFAKNPDTFEINAASGYGVEDCLGEGGECGQVVADAWCESHGHGSAIKFGKSYSPSPIPAPYFITCGE